MDPKLRVFLCHAFEDKNIVRELYQRLQSETWIDPWLDEEKLLPGQDWDLEIEKALEAADAVIVCLSNNSVTKEGYVQKEVRQVLDISSQKPEGAIFLIPLRLDDCKPPRRLASWHYVDYFPVEQQDFSYRRLTQALRVHLEKHGLRTEKNQLAVENKQTRVPSNHSTHYHSATVLNEVARMSTNGVNFVVAKLQWGKADVGYSLHVEPSTYTTAGMQITDFLAYLGFQRDNCSFVPRRECYTTWVDPEFDLSEFSKMFSGAFGIFEKATRTLDGCGVMLDQPEGWGYFYGKSSGGTIRNRFLYHNIDGHTSNQSKVLRESEDDYFYYKLSWIETYSSKGWSFHYRLRDHSDPYLLSALNFLRLRKFSECPFFDFEECFWAFVGYETKGDAFSDSNAQFVHQAFEGTRNNFPLALQLLAQANQLISPFGFQLLK